MSKVEKYVKWLNENTIGYNPSITHNGARIGLWFEYSYEGMSFEVFITWFEDRFMRESGTESIKDKVERYKKWVNKNTKYNTRWRGNREIRVYWNEGKEKYINSFGPIYFKKWVEKKWGKDI